MQYTIAIIEDIQNEVTVSFDKVGNKFQVALRNLVSNEFTRLTFDSYYEAKERFMSLSSVILDGNYSYQTRKEILRGKKI